MSDEAKYVMDICELCQKPIGYRLYATDAKGARPIHMACLNETDLKEKGFIPVTRDETPPDDDGSEGHA